jgi:hypothetical protein
MAYKNSNNKYKDVYTLWNSQCACLTLGYVDKSPYLKIAAVNEEFKGKKAQSGVEMYAHKAGVMFSLDISRLETMLQNWDKMLEGTLVMEFKNRSSDDMKVLTIGKNLFESDEIPEGAVCFNVAVLDRDEPDPENPKKSIAFWGEPVLYTAKKKSIVADSVFRRFIEAAINRTLMGLHLMGGGDDDGGGGGGYDRSEAPRPAAGGGLRRSPRPAAADDDDEDEAPAKAKRKPPVNDADEDEVPFGKNKKKPRPAVADED